MDRQKTEKHKTKKKKKNMKPEKESTKTRKHEKDQLLRGEYSKMLGTETEQK